MLSRFGISAKKFELLLKRYCDITYKAGCVPTFAITASVMARHPHYIKELSNQGVEFAVHGYVHIDYKVLPQDKKVEHFKKAIDIFKIYNIPFVGFRAPFLRVNGHTTKILSNLGFTYHSSRVIHWPVMDLNEFSPYQRDNHNRLLEFCTPLDGKEYFALPRSENGLIEIPVSIPDDESLVERLGITNQKKISEIWQVILQDTYDSGELFTLSLHPERIKYCETALIDILQKAKGLNPPVWVTTLKEIAEWWKEKDNFTFEINSRDDDRYRVKANCSDRATILLKNSKVNVSVNEWFNGYQSISARDFVLEITKPPIIGVGCDSSPSAVGFLKSEGYIVEESDNPDNYGIYLNNLVQFDEADEKPLSRRIEQSNVPLLRYWRWPNKARSAMSVSGDIDSMTIIDFVLRIFENLR